MIHVEQFLSKILNLYHFELIAQGYLNLIDDQKWELLVSHLTIFNFRLHLPCSLPDFSKENILDSFCSSQTETTLDTINGNDRIESTLSQGTNVTRKKSKPDDQSSKKGNKSSKKSNITVIDDNDGDIYRIVEVTRGDELLEGATESGNEDNDHDVIVGKNKKYDPHRALNIDLNEKPIQSIPTSPPLLTSQLKEPVPKQVETPPILTGKPKKSKKNKIIEKQEQSSTLKSKHKRERSDYKELLSPADEEENCPTSTPSPSAIAKKPKKKNHHPSIAQLYVTFLVKNRTSFIIDHINIHCIDSMSSKLLNTTSANLISFPSINLFFHSQNYIHICFSINAISCSQKLKTTLTYSINKSNIIETDRIEFKLNLPCSQYLRRKTIDSIAFADLMSSGVLICQSQLRISSSNQDFLLIINTICQSYRLTVVEKINSAASLYAETILEQPIAFLFKSIF
ncbi:unnamed protein product [Rotaria sordida]|uniref:AP-3 complex subunit delta domain-containing protein n=1 Tax=Rotaria sordida TaxID=392033 RepID=A0A815VZR8_9BILA|nr:unnamed protein product [Rotaria sordida]CAF1541536.1 unnamed protein product [Rotaria sordida]